MTASGLFSGNIKLVYTPNLPKIVDGNFTSDGPGSLRIDPAKINLPENASTVLLKKALQDFQFSEVNATLTSDERGTIKLHATISGVSKKIGSGQALVLNLSIEDNIPKLIESLEYLAKDSIQNSP